MEILIVQDERSHCYLRYLSYILLRKVPATHWALAHMYVRVRPAYWPLDFSRELHSWGITATAAGLASTHT